MLPYKIVNLEEEDSFIPQGNLFSSKNWMKVLARTYGYNIQYFVMNNSAITIIPFTVINNLKGSRVSSFPFCDYINTSTIEKENYLKFVRYLTKQYPKLPIILKTTYNESVGIGTVLRKAFVHRINLHKGINYTSAFQRGIIKAKSFGLKVKHTNTMEGLHQFYCLYGNLRVKKFNSIPQPFSFFKNIFDVFIAKGLGEIITVTHEKKAIASVIALTSNNTVFYKFGASDLAKLDFRPNNFLFDYLIRFSIKKGFKYIDLGLSGESDSYIGLRRFKESMGGERTSITYFRINPNHYNAKHEIMVSDLLNKYTASLINSKVQLAEIEKVSNLIYKNFA